MTTTHEPSIQILDSSRWIDLERADAARKAIEAAASELEKKGGNELYRRAWRIAANFIRTLPHGGK